MRHRGYRSRTLLGVNAPLTVRRARFQSGKTGKILFPLDELPDPPRGEVTPSLARRPLRLSTHLAFADLQEEMLEQHGDRVHVQAGRGPASEGPRNAVERAGGDRDGRPGGQTGQRHVEFVLGQPPAAAGGMMTTNRCNPSVDAPAARETVAVG